MITPRKIVSELTSIWTTSLVSYYQYGFVILTSTQGRIANREQQMLVIDLEDISKVRVRDSAVGALAESLRIARQGYQRFGVQCEEQHGSLCTVVLGSCGSTYA